jgi:DNA-binding response OmpR family regulator
VITPQLPEQDIILGLNLGAAEPFCVGELVAHANAFLRRSGGTARPCYCGTTD